jgi:hypothetical protein
MQQLRLSLGSTVDHWEIVNSQATKNLVIWTPRLHPHWHVVGAEHARKVLATLDGQHDVFVTPNEFYGWRMVRHLAKLDALYVDIDAPDAHADPSALVETALSRVVKAQIPAPSFIVYSGRGAHLYWLFTPVPAAALPRWQACQRRLQKLLFSDPAAVDCTRVLRVVGSANPRATPERRTVMGEQLCRERYDFDWLCEQVLPAERAVIRDIRGQRARKSEKKRREANGKGIYAWWTLVYQDLITISNFHWFGGVKEGHRDTFLFLTAVALSWFTRSDALKNEIAATARQLMPTLNSREVESYTTSVVNRAMQSADGETVKWRGQQRDPRYWFKRETLYQLLEALIPVELIDDLRAIVPKHVIEQRKRDRDGLRSRVKEGRYQTPQHDAQLRFKACEMRKQGISIRAIAVACAVSRSTVSEWVRSANTNCGSSDFARLT